MNCEIELAKESLKTYLELLDTNNRFSEGFDADMDDLVTHLVNGIIEEVKKEFKEELKKELAGAVSPGGCFPAGAAL